MYLQDQFFNFRCERSFSCDDKVLKNLQTVKCGRCLFRDIVSNQTDDDGVEILPPSYEEVKVAIMRLKTNKVAGPDGLYAELFQTGCNELVGSMHQFIH